MNVFVGSFEINLPGDRWETILGVGRPLLGHKFIEINLYKSNTLFKINSRIRIREDHAGAEFFFGLFGIELEVDIYDDRHWHDELNQWEK